ncbi:MAG: hypothetical protein ACLTZB_01465 [Streptococcus salivarius]
MVGMVSASQLEASFKQAADSSKSGQGQESFDELELTDYATGKVDDEQVTEYEVQQVDAEEEQEQLDELALSDIYETFNHSEPHQSNLNDSVLEKIYLSKSRIVFFRLLNYISYIIL